MSVQRMNIVHCDLKSANCLVDKHWSVKICDFGLSRLASGAQVPESTAVGTPEWMAPELLRNDPVTDKCDIFSLGVIMWELCTLKKPWEGVKPMEVSRTHEKSPSSQFFKLPVHPCFRIAHHRWCLSLVITFLPRIRVLSCSTFYTFKKNINRKLSAQIVQSESERQFIFEIYGK